MKGVVVFAVALAGIFCGISDAASQADCAAHMIHNVAGFAAVYHCHFVQVQFHCVGVHCLYLLYSFLIISAGLFYRTRI